MCLYSQVLGLFIIQISVLAVVHLGLFPEPSHQRRPWHGGGSLSFFDFLRSKASFSPLSGWSWEVLTLLQQAVLFAFLFLGDDMLETAAKDD